MRKLYALLLIVMIASVAFIGCGGGGGDGDGDGGGDGGNGGDSPKATVEAMVKAQEAKDRGKIWDLYTADMQAKELERAAGLAAMMTFNKDDELATLNEAVSVTFEKADDMDAQEQAFTAVAKDAEDKKALYLAIHEWVAEQNKPAEGEEPGEEEEQESKFTVGEEKVDGETATVDVEMTFGEDTMNVRIPLKKVDGKWLIDGDGDPIEDEADDDEGGEDEGGEDGE